MIPENIHTLPWARSWNSGEGVGVEHFGFSGGGRVKMFTVPVAEYRSFVESPIPVLMMLYN